MSKKRSTTGVESEPLQAQPLSRPEPVKASTLQERVDAYQARVNEAFAEAFQPGTLNKPGSLLAELRPCGKAFGVFFLADEKVDGLPAEESAEHAPDFDPEDVMGIETEALNYLAPTTDPAVQMRVLLKKRVGVLVVLSAGRLLAKCPEMSQASKRTGRPLRNFFCACKAARHVNMKQVLERVHIRAVPGREDLWCAVYV